MRLWDISRIVFIHLVNNDHVLWTFEHIIHNEESLREGKKLCCKWGKATCMLISLGFARHLSRQWPKIKHVWDHVSAYETSMWTIVTSQHWAWKANLLKIMRLWSHQMRHSHCKTHYKKCWICTKINKEKTRPLLSSIIDSYSNKFLMAR